jgi:protein pelota
MKLLGKHLERDGSVSIDVNPKLKVPMFISLQGHVTVRPEDDEDMWHLYNLIQEVSQFRVPLLRTS